MAILQVLHFPDERLRQKAPPVARIDEDIKRIAADMLETMYDEGGIGLAATQVNIQRRIAVIDLSEEKNQPLYLINPEIIRTDGKEIMREGCLSVPGYFDVVERAERIEFRYQTLAGETVTTETGGLFAICVQHEIDHLNGRLFIDYLSPLKRQRLKKKIGKLEKRHQQAS